MAAYPRCPGDPSCPRYEDIYNRPACSVRAELIDYFNSNSADVTPLDFIRPGPAPHNTVSEVAAARVGAEIIDAEIVDEPELLELTQRQVDTSDWFGHENRAANPQMHRDKR